MLDRSSMNSFVLLVARNCDDSNARLKPSTVKRLLSLGSFTQLVEIPLCLMRFSNENHARDSSRVVGKLLDWKLNFT